MTDLSRVPLPKLLEEVLSRQHELVTPKGHLIDEAFRLADALGIRLCIDGIPARRNSAEEVQLMAIRRNTGAFAGKLCAVGGGIDRIVLPGNISVPESFEDALRRHFRNDLGYRIEPLTDWRTPQLTAQEMRPINDWTKPDFDINPNSRHLVAVRYLVEIQNPDSRPDFGSTKFGGQEANGIEWFTKDGMPAIPNFGYGHARTYKALFPIAEELLAN